MKLAEKTSLKWLTVVMSLIEIETKERLEREREKRVTIHRIETNKRQDMELWLMAYHRLTRLLKRA